MTSDGYVITEERGLLYTLLGCILLLSVSIILVLISKKRYGNNKIHLPLVFSSVLMMVLILHTTYKTGLFSYA